MKPFAKILEVIRKIQGQRDVYTLREIYDEFDKGLHVQNILDKHSDLTLKSALYARAFYKANNPQKFKKRKLPILRALVDENIGIEHSVDGAAEVIGHATHITFEGLRTKKDSQIWAHARYKGFDFIITKDKACKPARNTLSTLDITRCAELRWKRELDQSGGVVTQLIREMPKIIHVPHDMPPVQIKNILRKHRERIFEIAEECVSPAIELTKGSAKPGKHFMEIYRGGDKEQIEELRNLRISALSDELGVNDLGPVSQKEISASLKKAIEHEISRELQNIHGRHGRILYLSMQVDIFDTHKYQYSGDLEKHAQAVERAKFGDKYAEPTHIRLERRRANQNLALA